MLRHPLVQSLSVSVKLVLKHPFGSTFFCFQPSGVETPLWLDLETCVKQEAHYRNINTKVLGLQPDDITTRVHVSAGGAL